jgi:hypothetical protein
MNGTCTSRPNCPCAFCVLSRTEPSATDEERAEAEAYVLAFCRERDRKMDAEAHRRGVLPIPLESMFKDFGFELEAESEQECTTRPRPTKQK